MDADAIFDCSRREDVVLDGFAGSDTTLLAAERKVALRSRSVDGPWTRERLARVHAFPVRFEPFE